MLNNQQDIKEFILNAEKRFPVNNWKLNGFHIWPFLRKELFFYLKRQCGDSSKPKIHVLAWKTSGFKVKLVRSRALVLLFLRLLAENTTLFLRGITYKGWLNLFPKKDYLFVGHKNHRTRFENKFFNRYFDSFIDIHGLENDYLFYEFGKELKGDRHKEEHIIGKELGYKLFRFRFYFKELFLNKYRSKVSLIGYDGFLSFLSQDKVTKGFAINYSIPFLKSFMADWNCQEHFFNDVLRAIQPKNVFTLYYYNAEVMALLAASNKLDIYTADFQHGSIGDSHLAYSDWDIAPKEGYWMLPKSFWVWDKHTNETINKWACKSLFHNTIVKGNPWIDYINLKNIDMEVEDGFILYALQPSKNYEDVFFNKKIVDTIRNNNYRWYIRLHPTSLKDKEEIATILSENKILKKVEIIKANQLPLPLLLKSAKAVVTFSSGCATEAALMNKKTIVLSEKGSIYFSGLIAERMAYYVPYDDIDFEERFTALIESL